MIRGCPYIGSDSFFRITIYVENSNVKVVLFIWRQSQSVELCTFLFMDTAVSKLLKEKMSGGDNVDKTNNTKRSINVIADGITHIVPDTCHILIRVSSQKGSVSQAKDSVERRVAYIKQSIQNNQIADSDVKVFESVQHGFTHTTELYITSTDMTKLQNLSEVLTQKLDESVTLSPISFSISPLALTHARSQSASNAVSNARKKAVEMVRLIEGNLGSPVCVEQLSCEESGRPSLVPDTSHPNSMFSLWQLACMSVRTSVRIIFEMKPRKT